MFTIHQPLPPPPEAESVRVQPGPGSTSMGNSGGGVSRWERLRKVTQASSLQADDTHTARTILRTHTHKSTFSLGLQTPSGP